MDRLRVSGGGVVVFGPSLSRITCGELRYMYWDINFRAAEICDLRLCLATKLFKGSTSTHMAGCVSSHRICITIS